MELADYGAVSKQLGKPPVEATTGKTIAPLSVERYLIGKAVEASAPPISVAFRLLHEFSIRSLISKDVKGTVAADNGTSA